MKLITGMHRSGTSLVARLIYESGGDFGDPETFYPPDRWNPDGYFEQPDVHAMNMPLVNGSLGRLSYLSLPKKPTILKRAEKMNLAVAAKTYGQKIVKETRFCLTLPAWLDQGVEIEKILICLRDPVSVAKSLKKRNRLPVWKGVKLWQQHYECLLENAMDIPRRIIYYDDLLNPDLFAKELRPSLNFLGLDADKEELTALFTKCVRPSDKVCGPIPKAVDRLWSELKEMHSNQFK
jgi:hypothetical protein